MPGKDEQIFALKPGTLYVLWVGVDVLQFDLVLKRLLGRTVPFEEVKYGKKWGEKEGEKIDVFIEMF